MGSQWDNDHHNVSALLCRPTWLILVFHKIFKYFLSVSQGSPVSGPRGLLVADRITRVDRCQVVSADAWVQCVQKTYTRPQVGYCVSKEQIRLQDTSLHRKLVPYPTTNTTTVSQFKMSRRENQTSDDLAELFFLASMFFE